jgi:hypothetical protein
MNARRRPPAVAPSLKVNFQIVKHDGVFQFGFIPDAAFICTQQPDCHVFDGERDITLECLCDGFFCDFLKKEDARWR